MIMRPFLRVFKPSKICEKEGCNFKKELIRKKLVKSHSSFAVAAKVIERNYLCPRCKTKRSDKWKNISYESIQSLSLPGSMQEKFDEYGEIIL